MRKQILEAFVGLQWGDEGKGKVVDERVCHAQTIDDKKRVIVVRYQGGANAGHTVYVRKNGELIPFVTHAAPTGLTNNADIGIGPQVAFNPELFLEEIKKAQEIFNYSGRILISERVGILFDYHKKLDERLESSDSASIGSTKQGIGPFYSDNAMRKTRMTFGEYVSDRFSDKLKGILQLKNSQLEEAEISRRDYLEQLIAKHNPIRKELFPFAERLEYRLQEYLENGEHIIIEGAQGTGLDVDMGTIPDQTSSHLLAPHAFPSLGLPRRAFQIYGVEKVYPTRVGKGILPTLSTDGFGESVAENAGEFGATTKRKRRVGYPDWVFVKRAVFLNDCNGIYLMRADNVQNREILVCTKYKISSGEISEVPLSLEDVKPVYSEKKYQWLLWEGHENLSNPAMVDEYLKPTRANYVRGGFNILPLELRQFVTDHDSYVRCKTVGISIGPGRGETVMRTD